MNSATWATAKRTPLAIALITGLALSSPGFAQSSAAAPAETSAVAQVVSPTATAQEASKQSQSEMALLQSRSYRNSGDSLPVRANTLKDVLLPLATWFFGSAVLAMIGYKRMRNSVTGTD